MVGTSKDQENSEVKTSQVVYHSVLFRCYVVTTSPGGASSSGEISQESQPVEITPPIRKRPGTELSEDANKSFKAQVPEEVTVPANQPNPSTSTEYAKGFPPKKIAVHGPNYLNLGKDDREWIKRVHHRMGHPDPQKFTKFLKDTHADSRIFAGALDFQCDACCEDGKGFALTRPSAIHTNLGFNEVVGLDVAYWKNDEGVKLNFLHFLDEGTLFHLGKSCVEDADSQIQLFDDVWMSWAGLPKTVYLDPASEYTGERWLTKMQVEDIQLKMTAADSHWQLGRVEAHGDVVKRMLDKMNAENPIRTQEEFNRVLR